jgi:hypothetical protein
MADNFVLVAVPVGLLLLGLAVGAWLPALMRDWTLGILDSIGINFDRLSMLQLAIGFLIALVIAFRLTYAFLGLSMRGR